jgi:hypothetical protein
MTYTPTTAGLALACWWAAAWAEIWSLVPTARSGRRGPRKHAEDQSQGDGVRWPLLREQQQLKAHIPEAEQAAAAERAQVLVSQGWGALEEWLNHPGEHPGERPAVAPEQKPGARRTPACLADLFEAA